MRISSCIPLSVGTPLAGVLLYISCFASNERSFHCSAFFAGASFSYFKFPSGIFIWIERCTSEFLIPRVFRIAFSARTKILLFFMLMLGIVFADILVHPALRRDAPCGCPTLHFLFYSQSRGELCSPVWEYWNTDRANTVRPYMAFPKSHNRTMPDSLGHSPTPSPEGEGWGIK